MKNCSAAELNTCQVTINLIFLREKLLKKYEREKRGNMDMQESGWEVQQENNTYL